MSDLIREAWRAADAERKARVRTAAEKAAQGRLLNEREQMDCYVYVPPKAFRHVAFFWSRLRPEYRYPLAQALKATSQGE